MYLQHDHNLNNCHNNSNIFSLFFNQVIRYEIIIHEFDPWFNYRTTQFLIQEGIYKLWNWFDPKSWYPLGRVVGGTLLPGLMVTSGFIHWFLEKIALPIDIKHICVFLAPVFAAFTSLTAFFFTKEITKKPWAALYSALFMAAVPGYTQRSIAGSYDYEAIAIFILLFTFYLYIKSVNTVIF